MTAPKMTAPKKPHPITPRTIYSVRWNKKTGDWYIEEHVHGSAEVKMAKERIIEKASAIRIARSLAKLMHIREGKPAQMLAFNKNGQIGKGGSAEASYGCDSKAKG